MKIIVAPGREAAQPDLPVQRKAPMAALFDPGLELLHAPMPSECAKIESAAGVGVAESARPVNMMPWGSNVESEGSRHGRTCTPAGGERLPTVGDQKLSARTPGGRAASARYQRADVTFALSAVAQMCEQGDRVAFEKHGGYLQHLQGGAQTRSKRVNNVYSMELYLEMPRGMPELGFTRPSRR